MPISPSLLRETFYPQTLTTTEDGSGGVTQSYSDGTSFKGRYSTLSAEERVSEDKVTASRMGKIYCNSITLGESSRIRNSDDTKHYEIKGILNPSNMSDHLEIKVLDID